MPRVGVASVVRGSKQIHRLWRAPLGSTYSATFIACMHQHFCIIYSSSRLPICPFGAQRGTINGVWPVSIEFGHPETVPYLAY